MWLEAAAYRMRLYIHYSDEKFSTWRSWIERISDYSYWKTLDEEYFLTSTYRIFRSQIIDQKISEFTTLFAAEVIVSSRSPAAQNAPSSYAY